MDELVESVVVLERGLDDGAVDLLLDIDGIGVHDLAVLVQVADVARYPTVKEVGDLVVGPQIEVPIAAEVDLHALVEVGHLLEALSKYAEIVFQFAENLCVGHERYIGAGIPVSGGIGLFRHEICLAVAFGELLTVGVTVSVDLYD